MKDLYTLPDQQQMFQTASRFPDVFLPRHPESHKGTHGTLALIGGTYGMSGALALAAASAAYLGCGKVWAGFHQDTLPFAFLQERPEIMLATAEKLLQRKDIDARAVGCGLGTGEHAHRLVHLSLLQNDAPLLLDADALNLLAYSTELAECAVRHGRLILTPHPAEAGRLLGLSTAQIQADRTGNALHISRRFNAVTVLKGHRSIVASPDDTFYINHSGNAGLACAGSGDVLSGICASLLAQGIPNFQAACAAVWLHGAAADIFKFNTGIETGMLAGEIAPIARWLRNRLMTRETV